MVARKPGPPLSISLILLIAGIAGVVAFTAVFADRVVNTHHTKQLTTPYDQQLQLSSGKWEIYVAGGSLGGISPEGVTVTGPAESAGQLSVSTPGDTETLTVSGREYTGVAQFNVKQGGTYEVKVASATTVSFIIGLSLGNLILHNLGWLGGTVVSGLIALLGLILLIVGIVRRGRVKRAPPMGWGGPGGPGWGGPGAGWGHPGPGWGGPGTGWSQPGPGWTPPAGSGSPPGSGPPPESGPPGGGPAPGTWQRTRGLASVPPR